jgi:hypothetical protein
LGETFFATILFGGRVCVMYDIFGRGFYEWWSGLSRVSRLLAALGILALAGIAAWGFPGAWLLWGPALAAGGVLLLAS